MQRFSSFSIHRHVSKESGRTVHIYLAFRGAADAPETEISISHGWCYWKWKVSSIRRNLTASCVQPFWYKDNCVSWTYYNQRRLTWLAPSCKSIQPFVYDPRLTLQCSWPHCPAAVGTHWLSSLPQSLATARNILGDKTAPCNIRSAQLAESRKVYIYSREFFPFPFWIEGCGWVSCYYATDWVVKGVQFIFGAALSAASS
jgi:hypothetical protein